MLEVLKQNRLSTEERVPLLDSALMNYTLTIEDIVQDRGEIVNQLKYLPRDKNDKREFRQDSTMALLGHVGHVLSKDVQTGNLSRTVSVEDILVPEGPQLFPLLVAWLSKSLRSNIQSQDQYCKVTLLLSDVAVYAQQSPSTFVNLAREHSLEPTLASVIIEHNNTAGRKAACELVSYFSSIQKATLNALLKALLDSKHVRDAAMDTIQKLRRIDGNIVSALIQRLEDPSATVASAAGQVLAILGRGERTPLKVRQRIVAALADVVQSPTSKRGIYTIGGTGASNSPQQLVY